MLNDTKEFQETLHEVLNTRLNTKSNQEILLQAILKKSDKDNVSDFQEMLRKNIKPLNQDKLKKDLEPKEKKLDSIKKDQNISHQVKSGANLDKIADDLDKEKDEKETKLSSGKELTTREETLKYMYAVALEEYYTLRENLYKYQIRDNNIAVDDRNYLKLLNYENYLRKCDTLFKASTGSYISNQDAEISKKENKYAYDAAKSERKVLSEHESSINEVDRLNSEIEDKANEIIELNNGVKNGDFENYEKKLSILESEYVSLNAKMHMLKPNILEIYRQEEQKEQQEHTTTRIVGTMYEKRKDKLVMDAQVVRLDRKVEGKDDLLDNAAENEKKELAETNLKVAKSYVAAAESALEKEDTKEAMKLVNKAKKLVGKEGIADISKDKKTDLSSILKKNVSSDDEDEIKIDEVNETEIIDCYLIDMMNENISLSPVQEECAKAVHTPEERGKNALAREAKEELEKASKEIVKEQDLSR